MDGVLLLLVEAIVGFDDQMATMKFYGLIRPAAINKLSVFYVIRTVNMRGLILIYSDYLNTC